jgi:hypothetical protein
MVPYDTILPLFKLRSPSVSYKIFIKHKSFILYTIFVQANEDIFCLMMFHQNACQFNSKHLKLMPKNIQNFLVIILYI